MSNRESEVEKYLHRMFTLRGGLTRKWVSPGYVGVMDRICILNGVVWFVEVKTFDGKMSPMQQREADRMTEAGANVRTVYGKNGVDELMKEVDGDN